MQWLDNIRDYVRQLDTRDLYKGLALFFGVLALLLSLTFYLHYRRVKRYTADLKTLDNLRSETKRIITRYKAVSAQKEKVEELLAQNKNFRIAETYHTIVEKLRLLPKLKGPITPVVGETISGKNEVSVSSHFSDISMKNLTDLLSQIATIQQLYTKELTIKKSANTQAIDVDITIATLESSTTE